MKRETPEVYRCKTRTCRAWNHWLNPFGNWLEPLPTPTHNQTAAEQSRLPPAVWWALRNPLTNLTHFWLGIVPVGARYVWETPEARGWSRAKQGNWSWWVKRGRLPLPYYRVDKPAFTFYAGWSSRGNLGLALRKNSGAAAS